MNNAVLIFKRDTGFLAQGFPKDGVYPDSDRVKQDAISLFGADNIDFVEKTPDEMQTLLAQVSTGTFQYDRDTNEIIILPPPTNKEEAIQCVRDYAEECRTKITQGAKTQELDSYQINSDILNLMDAGKAFEELDQFLQDKVNIEVINDNRYSTKEQLFAVWRQKRGFLTIATTWVSTMQANTIALIEAATTQEEINTIVEQARIEAKTKLEELLSQ